MPLRFDWDKLRVFRVVAEVGSFTKAAEILSVHQSALSRSIAILEDSLNAPLFHRHSRGLKLTDEGQILYQTAQSIIHLLNNAEGSIASRTEKVAGEITFTTSQCFSSKWLISIISEFLTDNPSVMLRTVIDDAELDLGMREADVALRLKQPIEPNLIAKHVGSLQYGLFAKSAYFSDLDTPKCIKDLQQHRIIHYSSLQQQFSKNIDLAQHPDIKNTTFSVSPLRMNNADNIIHATEAKLGIALLPVLQNAYPDDFVQVLEDVHIAELPIYIVFDRDIASYKRIQALKNHISKAFATPQSQSFKI